MTVFRNHSEVNHELCVVVEGMLKIVIIDISDFAHSLLYRVHELYVEIVVGHFFEVIVILAFFLVVIVDYIYLLRLLVLGPASIIFWVVRPVDWDEDVVHFLEMLSLADDWVYDATDVEGFFH